MKKVIILCLSIISAFAQSFAGKVPLVSQNEGVYNGTSRLNSPELLHNIMLYQNWGELFVYFQVHWFRILFFGITVGVLVVFFLHYVIIGPKKFSHDRVVYVYNLFKRIIHWIAALAFVIVVPTGLMMIFGKELGGGALVLNARHLHSIGSVLFLVSVIPMFFMWLIPMLPTFDDVKWVFMAGGYLTKKKVVVPAGQFNAGQKMWFWLATIGGFVMIITGAVMYFEDFDLAILKGLNLDQIDILRISAIVHNFLGMGVTAFFITHMYMALFAIKGSLGSMISGNKSEDEIKYMHSSLYKKLKKEDKI